jgi:hypothetical protein
MGISLRRNQNGLARYTLDGRGAIPARGSIGIVDLHVHKTGEVSQAAAHDAPLAKCALTMSHEGKELGD